LEPKTKPNSSSCSKDASCIKTFEDLVKSDYCMMFFARGCRNKRFSRGLCPKHYQIIRRLVKSGVMLWSRVEIQLKALPNNRESQEAILKNLGVKD
jgi:hypothetical protein